MQIESKKIIARIVVFAAILVCFSGCTSRGELRHNKSRDALITEIRSFKNTPYVYGGSTPSGTDCSGFTMRVFKRFGYNLPHSASKQAKMGRPVSRANLKMGDLVFFRTSKSRAITHVGIYLWSGKMVHASSGKGIIVIKWMGHSYWEKRYAGARRIVDF